jgi:hypothetical protein
MLKVHILIRRRSDMTHEQCVAYWRDVHAPLFASQPDVKRYVAITFSVSLPAIGQPVRIWATQTELWNCGSTI